MKKLILLTICTILLLTGCGQAAAPEVDTVPAIVQEETIPTTDTQDVPTGIAEVAVEPTISEIPAQSQHAPVVAPLEEPAITVLAEPPTADTPTQTPEPALNTGLDTVPAQTAEEVPSAPPATGGIYSVEEAVRVGNEYAKAQYGVTIDTSMTTADSSYYPGTADSVARLTGRRQDRPGIECRRLRQCGRHLRLSCGAGRCGDCQRIRSVQLRRPLQRGER